MFISIDGKPLPSTDPRSLGSIERALFIRQHLKPDSEIQSIDFEGTGYVPTYGSLMAWAKLILGTSVLGTYSRSYRPCSSPELRSAVANACGTVLHSTKVMQPTTPRPAAMAITPRPGKRVAKREPSREEFAHMIVVDSIPDNWRDLRPSGRRIFDLEAREPVDTSIAITMPAMRRLFPSGAWK